MRRLVLLALDIGLVVSATIFSLVLRENFDVSASRFLDFIPYLTATIAAAGFVIPGFGLHRSIWRFSAKPDYLRVVAASLAVVLGATVVTFVANRLDGVARSLPILQLIMCQAFLIGARVLHKMSHESHQNRKASTALLQLADKDPHSTVLIVGVSTLMEAYLRAMAELAPGRIRVAGIVGRTGRNVGRSVATHPVLGVPEDIQSILDSLEVHGVTVDRVVMTSPFRDSDRARTRSAFARRTIAGHFPAVPRGGSGA